MTKLDSDCPYGASIEGRADAFRCHPTEFVENDELARRIRIISVNPWLHERRFGCGHARSISCSVFGSEGELRPATRTVGDIGFPSVARLITWVPWLAPPPRERFAFSVLGYIGRAAGHLEPVRALLNNFVRTD